MNSVDVLILVIVVAAVVNGVLLGAAVQALSFGGFWLGWPRARQRCRWSVPHRL